MACPPPSQTPLPLSSSLPAALSSSSFTLDSSITPQTASGSFQIPNRRLDGCFRCNCRKTEERDLPPWERTPSTPVLGMAAVVARFLYTLPIHLSRVSCYSVPFSFIHSLPNLISGIYLLIQDAEKDSGVTTFL